MRTPALVATDAAPADLGALFAAAARRGVRVGWLELRTTEPLPAPWNELSLAGPAKQVTVGAEGSLALKPRRGSPVLRDLLREHFTGYGVVLVRGHGGTPRLTVDAAGFRLEPGAGSGRSLGADELLDELLRPGHRA